MGGMAAGAGTALQLGGGIADMLGRNRAQEQQRQQLNNWYLYQALQRQQEYMRQDAFRNDANAARTDVLNNDVSATAQKANQAKEASRLETAYAANTVADKNAPSVSDANIASGKAYGALTGQGGGDQEFRADLARRLNAAASDARDRISALATMNSYGDSFGGLGTLNPIAFQRAGWGINQANNFRRGSLQAYGVESAIEPPQVQYRGSPIAMGLQGVGGFLSGLGKGEGGQF